MQKLVWQNASGVELDLTSGNYGITEWEGFSNASLNIQSQQVPFQDGGVFLDALIEQRELSVTLAMQDNNNLELRYQQRRELISALNPKLGEGYLIYTNDYTSKRIKCVPQIPLFETHNSDTVGTPKASLSWTACEPYWEDLEETEVIVTDERKTIINNGDVPCGVKIRLLAEQARDIKINNVITKKQIRLTENYVENDTVYINTNVGQKEVISKDESIILKTAYNNKFNKIKYFEGLERFIVVGDNGYVLLSEDGREFNIINSESLWGKDFVEVTYSKTRDWACVVGEVICAMRIDRETNEMVVRGSTTPNDLLYSATYFKNTDNFFAVGKDGTFGKMHFEEEYDLWLYEDITPFTDKDLYGIASDSTRMIAVGKEGTMFKSTDGVTWTEISQSVITEDIKQIIYTGINLEGYLSHDFFIVRTADKIYISDHYGANWQLFKDLTGYTILNMDLCGYYLIITTAEKIIKCNIYIQTEWSEMSVPNNLAGNLIGCAYSRELGIFVFFTQYGMKCINASNTLLPNAWENNIGVIFGSITGICESKDKLFAVTESGNIYKSKDGNNWEQVFIINGIGNYYGICYSKNLDLLVAVGYSEYSHNSIITSQDGINWTVRSTDEQALRSIVYAEEGASPMFVAVGDNGLVKISVDGINWETYSSGHSLKCIIYAYNGEGINHYVAGGADGSILRSYDAINWTQVGSFNGSINAIAYSKLYNLFGAVGSTDGIVISENATDWVLRVFGDTSSVRDIIFSEEEGYFKVVGVHIFSQTINLLIFDGVQSPFTLNKVIYSQLLKNFIFGGLNGVIVTQGTKEVKNILNLLSNESDLNFNLAVGENIVNATTKEGIISMKLTYRQKYIGV